MEEQTEIEISYSGDATESSDSSPGDATESSDSSPSESVGVYDLPPGFERFVCDSPVPAGFEWCTCDLAVQECCADVCDLLMDEAPKGSEDKFRFVFTTDYLRWSCCPPGYLPDLHIGIWDGSSRQLVAFIAAVPIRVRVMDESSRMAWICFPAVRSDFRDKIPANVIHGMIIRRIRANNIRRVVSQKVTIRPAPIAFPVWQRPLNSRALFKFGLFKSAAMTLPEIMEYYKLPYSPDIRGFKGMNASHIEPLAGLLREYLQQFSIAPKFDKDEVKHWFLPTADLLHSYVFVKPNGNITGFCSFLTLRQFREDSMVKFAYSFYNFTVGMPIQELMKDAIIMARENRCDSFYACDIMSNGSFLRELRFSPTILQVRYDLDFDGIFDLKKDDLGLVLL